QVSRERVPLGARVGFTGTVVPNHKGSTVFLQRLSGRHWLNVDSATLGARSGYSMHWRASGTGASTFRIVIPARGAYVAGVSVPVVVRVS
ncbi:MAG: hypothetical protein ACRDP1_03105, partial [Nocardioidaceae bacterium]